MLTPTSSWTMEWKLVMTPIVGAYWFGRLTWYIQRFPSFQALGRVLCCLWLYVQYMKRQKQGQKQMQQPPQLSYPPYYTTDQPLFSVRRIFSARPFLDTSYSILRFLPCIFLVCICVWVASTFIFSSIGRTFYLYTELIFDAHNNISVGVLFLFVLYYCYSAQWIIWCRDGYWSYCSLYQT